MSTGPMWPITAALALILAGCGSGDSPQPADTGTEGSAEDSAEQTDGASSQEASGDFPVTVDTPAGEVTLPVQPERIVSLSPSATEILFAIGAGDQVVAADEYSTYPEDAPTTDLSGFDPNVEAIVGYEPDLVVIANDSNDLVASLQEVDIPVLVNPAPTTIDEGWDGMATLGLATGHVDETAGLIADLRQQLDDAFAAASRRDAENVRVYHELDSSLFAASSNSFIGDVYSRLGAVNIADEADVDGTGFPQLTEEAIVQADPQLIVITDQVDYTAEDVAARPGWGDVEAVRNGDIVVVDADIASRWGPRLPQLVEVVADAMDEVAVPAGR